MKIVNLNDVPQQEDKSPKGKYRSFSREISISLGREKDSTDAKKRHPFDLALMRIPAGATPFPYHIESAQWEMYLVVSGQGTVRHEGGFETVLAGDSFYFSPGEAHTFSNQGTEDFVYYVIADNPIGDCCYYPDSDKWAVGAGKKSAILHAKEGKYFDGEE